MRVQKSIDIAAPPERIWPFFTNPDKILQWSIIFRKFEYTSDRRSGVGTPIYIEEKAGGPLMKMNFEVTEWVENEKIGLRMTSGPMLKSYEQRWTLQRTPSGSTFTFMEDLGLPFGPIGKLIGRMMQRSSEAFIDRMLPKIKMLAEA